MRKERSCFYKQEDDTVEGSDYSEISRKKKLSVFPGRPKWFLYLVPNTAQSSDYYYTCLLVKVDS